jgi:Xaa-Pro aminopeptidase
VGNSVNCVDLFYLSNFLSEDDFVYLSAPSPTIFVSSMEFERAKRESKVSVESLQDYGKKIEEALVEILKKRELKNISVPPYFPLSIAERLKSEGMKLKVISDIVPQRRIKNPEEVKKISISQRIAGEAMKMVLRILKKSKEKGGILYYGDFPLTSERLKTLVSLKLISLSSSCEMMIISSGTQTAIPHHRGEGEIKSGESIVVDIFPKHTLFRYHGDLSRTFVVGEPAQELREAYDHVLNAQQLALSMIHSGLSCRELHSAVKDYFSDHGYETDVKKSTGFIHSTGHGIGLEIHEPPLISENDETLERGNVITVEPGLYFPKRFGVRVEDVAVVHRDGVKIIEGGVPKILEVWKFE